MFYLGATDQRVTLVDESGHEIYSTDFKNFPNVLTHLRPLDYALHCPDQPGGGGGQEPAEGFEIPSSRRKRTSIPSRPFPSAAQFGQQTSGLGGAENRDHNEAEEEKVIVIVQRHRNATSVCGYWWRLLDGPTSQYKIEIRLTT